MNEQYQSLRKSIASQINDNTKDSAIVGNMMKNIFDDEVNYNHPMTAKST